MLRTLKLPLATTLLLATPTLWTAPAFGGSTWNLWRQASRTTANNSTEAWKVVEAFTDMATCTAGELSTATAMAEVLNQPVLNGRPGWKAYAVRNTVKAFRLDGEMQMLDIEYRCFPDTEDPRKPLDPGADAGSEWIMIYPPTTDLLFTFDTTTPLYLWEKSSDRYATGSRCQRMYKDRVAVAEKAVPESGATTFQLAVRTLQWTRVGQCIRSDDPRLVSVPTPAPPSVPPRSTGGMGVIRYTPGRPIVAIVRLNGLTAARLILDTGADGSTVKPELLAAAGVDLSRPVGRGEISGVVGKTTVFYYRVSFEVAGHVAQVPEVAALNPKNAGVDGLLGRDFLDHFKVLMDPAAGTVTLVPR